ncbi:MAG: hypothetical protein KGN76_04480 [Acidobacteriota bacterium]|nr:hypothetical protein [Acidobacteriota bacterium]
MPVRRTSRLRLAAAVLAAAGLLTSSFSLQAASPAVRATTAAQGAPAALPTPEQFFGFRIGTDNKLARWDKMVEYYKLVAGASDRVNIRDLGPSTNGNPFVALEISSPDTLKNLDHFKEMERRLYFQGGPPTPAERDEIFRTGKVVLVITCSIHATEIGATQMSLELVHRLATDNSPEVKKILDNVIFVLVPSLNPDGEIIVTDWFNRNIGTPYARSPVPVLYHPYVGHDNNRDMYMFTQKESQMTARLLWHDWYPSVWLDEHQMGSMGPRIFTMPATDPINPNVNPLIYRWNGILGQLQAAALEAEGKSGIIYNSTYTNFWEGAMAWAGWWHNEVGLLTEVASVDIAAPTDQKMAHPGQRSGEEASFQEQMRQRLEHPDEPLPAPRDITPRTVYPRPWMGGHWTLRDIVDYEMTATMALLTGVAEQRETILRQIYAVNAETVRGVKGFPSAIVIPVDGQHDAREAVHLVDKLQMAGVDVYRADAPIEADGHTWPAGTFVIPMHQVFARYAKDMIEPQTYPEVRLTPDSPPIPPYDVTAWSLGMLLGVQTTFVKQALPADAKLTKLDGVPALAGRVAGTGSRFVFPYDGADTAAAINQLLKDGARVSLFSTREGDSSQASVAVTGISRAQMETAAKSWDLDVRAGAMPKAAPAGAVAIKAPRIGMYQPWTGGNMDEGWTRWVLEHYGFQSSPLHNADIQAGKLREKFDVIILADQAPTQIVDGWDYSSIRPEYRGGIGDKGVDALRDFVAHGGTLVTLGQASDFAIKEFPIPVRNVKDGLNRNQHFAPGTILHVEVDTTNPIGYGVAPETWGFYINSPFFEVRKGFSPVKTDVIARYPNTDLVASGWLKGEQYMAGHAAVVSIDMNPGRLVLFGLRPQHRAQTHATFPLLFNALYLATANQ